MSRLNQHPESHLVARIGWLRAAVLGANDGIVSTTSLIVGVAAADAKPNSVLIAGIAGPLPDHVDGGRRVCFGQLAIRYRTSRPDPRTHGVEPERRFRARGAGPDLCPARRRGRSRATSGAAIDGKRRSRCPCAYELGISEITTARPVQAALTSAATFAIGAALPLLMVLITPALFLVVAVSLASLLFLALLGAVGAKAGGADVGRATVRVTFWGALAMALTAGVGAIFGAAV